jgi:amino acid transporter
MLQGCGSFEAVLTGITLLPTQPHRLVLLLLSMSWHVQVIALLQLPVTQVVGELVGLLLCGVLMAYYIKRCIATKDPGEEWPGPKAPPAGMALAAFLCANLFIQSLQA